MDNRSLVNVLAILRLLKAANQNASGIALIGSWCRSGEPSEGEILKFASFLVEQISEAQTVISNSQLDPEAIAGITSTLEKMRTAFSLKSLGSSPRAIIGDITGAIANFVILLSAVGVSLDTTLPDEANKLIDEIEKAKSLFNDGSLDPVIRKIGKQHLEILATLLRHVPLFGVEAALTTYFELMLRLRQANAGASKKSKEATKPIFEKIEEWADRFETIDKAWNTGTRWVGKAGKALSLLSHIPD